MKAKLLVTLLPTTVPSSVASQPYPQEHLNGQKETLGSQEQL